MTADTVTSSASTSYNGLAYQVSGSTQLVNAKVAGVSVSANAAPNTRSTVAGVGTVWLNRQVPISSGGHGLQVEAVVVDVTAQNSYGLPVGAHIVVAHSRSVLVGPVAALVFGMAYGTAITLNGQPVNAQSGPTAAVYVPCGGTDGQTRTNPTAAVSTPILTTGTIQSSATATAAAISSQVQTTSVVQTLELLPGASGSSLITADVVKAVASSSGTPAAATTSDSGSTIVNLNVAGVPVADSPDAHLVIAGIGDLYLHRVVRSGSHIEVRMIELDLTTAVDGYPAGSRIVVSDASAGLG